MRILVLGMDGNVLDSHKVKYQCAGRALLVAVRKFAGIEKDVKVFEDIYIETAGKNSLVQFEIAYRRVTNQDPSRELLEYTERIFRRCLAEKEVGVNIFPDTLAFFKKFNSKYPLIITTTVPINRIPIIFQHTHLADYINMGLARGGAYIYQQGIWRVEKIPAFDKGRAHFDYICHYYNVNHDALVAINSSTADIEYAKEYGIISIGVEHIFDEQTLQSAGADYTVKDFYELMRQSQNPNFWPKQAK